MPSNFYRSDGWVKLVSGQAVPGAQVYVLNQPANVVAPITPPRTLPVAFVPNPQVQVYSDAGFTPISQPILTDGFGHYDFYALPGLYTVAIFFGGKLQQFYIDQTIGNVGTAGISSVVLETNGSPNFNQGILNLQQGTNIILTPDNFGNVTITSMSSGVVLKTNGVTNGNQALLNLVNGTNMSVTQDGAGNVTLAAAVSGSFLPQPDVAYFAMLAAGGGTTTFSFNLNDNINVSNVGSTGAVGPSATQGCAVQSNAGIFWGGNNFVWPTRSLNFKTSVQINQSAGSPSYWGLVSGTNASPLSADGISVGFIPGSANWKLICSTGGTSTTVDSGVAIALNTSTKLHIAVASGVATLYVNGVSACTCSTNVPTSNPLRLQWYNLFTGTFSLIATEYLYVDNILP